MVRSLGIWILILFYSSLSFAQKKEPYADKGLWRATATFSLGLMRDNIQSAYLQGNLEYYVSKKFSVRGEGFYFFNHLNNEPLVEEELEVYSPAINTASPLLQNHSLLFGGLFHFPTNNTIDPYVGFLPGIAFTERDEFVYVDSELVRSNSTINPVFSGVFGMNYYAGKYFHLFLEGQFFRGVHTSNGLPKYLDELKLSFGLGFDIK